MFNNFVVNLCYKTQISQLLIDSTFLNMRILQ